MIQVMKFYRFFIEEEIMQCMLGRTAADRSNGPSDDRGANVGDMALSVPIDTNGDGIFEDCDGNNLSDDPDTPGFVGMIGTGVCLTCSDDWEQNSMYASNEY